MCQSSWMMQKRNCALCFIHISFFPQCCYGEQCFKNLYVFNKRSNGQSFRDFFNVSGENGQQPGLFSLFLWLALCDWVDVSKCAVRFYKRSMFGSVLQSGVSTLVSSVEEKRTTQEKAEDNTRKSKGQLQILCQWTLLWFWPLCDNDKSLCCLIKLSARHSTRLYRRIWVISFCTKWNCILHCCWCEMFPPFHFLLLCNCCE